MRYVLALFLFFGLGGTRFAHSQDTAAQAAALAERREIEERYKHLRAMYEELAESLALQQKRASTLVDEINRLRDENSQLNNKLSSYVTRDELRKLVEKVQDIDTKREADKKLILEEIQRLAKVAATPPPAISRPPAATKTIEPTENYYPHKVEKGETLSEIIKVYNADLKERGLPPVTLDQVKKANPRINADRLVVGKEILLPIPSK